MDKTGKRVIAYLGPEGSYTHQATLDTISTGPPPPPLPSTTSSPGSPSTIPQALLIPAYTLTPVPTITDVFAAVQNGSAYRGVVPFENSSNGSVVFTLDLLADRQGKYGDVQVCREAYVRVRHCLCVYAGEGSGGKGGRDLIEEGEAEAEAYGESRARESDPMASTASATAADTVSAPVPGRSEKRPRLNHDSTAGTEAPSEETIRAATSRITKLYSHPQAWTQCTGFLKKYLAHATRIDVSSTSRAAELVAADPSGTSAAISSSMAARIFGLGVVKEGIEDKAGNTTRFLMLRDRRRASTSSLPEWEKREIDFENGVLPILEEENKTESEPQAFKTMLSLTIDHHNPGALASALAVFANAGINLTSINTRPSGTENWNYIFFVEVKGNLGDVEGALRELEGVARSWRYLGSWRSRDPDVKGGK